MVIAFWISAVLVAYVLFGYPILMRWIAKLFGAKDSTRPGEEDLPFVSFVIPAHNEIQVIQPKLENTLALDYPKTRMEILVGSDGSVDGTNEVVKDFEDRGVRLLDYSVRRGKASVLNDTVAQAKGDILCLCDANVMFQPDALRNLVDRLRDPDVGAATGSVVLRSDESNFGDGEEAYYGVEREIQMAESSVGSLMGVDGGMYVIRRELFSPLPPDTILDDFIISMRVIQQGARVVYEPRAIASESGTPIAMQEWRRRVRVAAGATQSILRGEFPPMTRPVEFWQYLSHKLLRWMTPLFLLVLLISSAFLAADHWFYAIMLGGQCLVYLGALVAATSVMFRQTKLGAIPFYFAMSNAAQLTGLLKGLLNMQPVMWAQADRS